MSDFDDIAETLRQRRKNLENQIDRGSEASGETRRIVAKLTELRRRSEETMRGKWNGDRPGDQE